MTEIKTVKLGTDTVQALANRYATLNYRVEIEPDECNGQPCFVARHPELLGCTTHGATPQEAVNSLKEVAREYIAILLEHGVEVPLPAPIVTNVQAGTMRFLDWEAFREPIVEQVMAR